MPRSPDAPATVIELPERMTHADTAVFVGGLDAQVSAGQGPLQVQAARLAQFDSSALAALLRLRRLALAAGRPFEVRGAPPRLVQLARLYGVGPLLGLAA